MKVSSKSRYGLAAMVDLASTAKRGPVTLAAIAKRQEISLNYLEQLFGSLKRAGMVASIKGPNGGYQLKLSAKEISCKDILEALEGEFTYKDGPKEDSLMEACLYEEVFHPLSNKIKTCLEEITLEQLVQSYKNKKEKEVIMYYI